MAVAVAVAVAVSGLPVNCPIAVILAAGNRVNKSFK